MPWTCLHCEGLAWILHHSLRFRGDFCLLVLGGAEASRVSGWGWVGLQLALKLPSAGYPDSLEVQIAAHFAFPGVNGVLFWIAQPPVLVGSHRAHAHHVSAQTYEPTYI